MRITIAWLKRRKACSDQVATFAREWPDGVEVSPRVLQRAAELTLDLRWFARKTLPLATYTDYLVKRDTLYAAYWAELAPLNADYEAKRDTLDADYRAKIATLLWELIKDGL